MKKVGVSGHLKTKFRRLRHPGALRAQPCYILRNTAWRICLSVSLKKYMTIYHAHCTLLGGGGSLSLYVEILLVVFCSGNWDKLRPNRPPSSNANYRRIAYMAPNLNHHTLENLSLVLMFQDKAFFLSVQG